MTEAERIKLKIWANLQDNLHRSDIIDRCQSAEHRALVQRNYDETAAEVERLRAELRELQRKEA